VDLEAYKLIDNDRYAYYERILDVPVGEFALNFRTPYSGHVFLAMLAIGSTSHQFEDERFLKNGNALVTALGDKVNMLCYEFPDIAVGDVCSISSQCVTPALDVLCYAYCLKGAQSQTIAYNMLTAEIKKLKSKLGSYLLLR
jgi:hypothetical protein